jgi:predicted metalloprotease
MDWEEGDMNKLTSWFAAAVLAMPIAGASGEVEKDSTAPDRPVRVTERDIDNTNKKVAGAYGALVTMWNNEFRRIGERFTAPRILRYEGATMTQCGVIRPENAEYCPNANTIFYDDVFVTGLTKLAANDLGTDGDMVAIGVIAHEMGHAVAMQVGYRSRNSYDNESTADCLAGAFTKQAQKDGSIEPGDIDEAFYGMSLAGDPTPEPTGNARYDRMIQARLVRESHGTKQQRMQNFRNGLEGGPQACLEAFR